MKIVTAHEMHMIDEKAIRELHVSRMMLMENAGEALVAVLKSHYTDLKKRKVIVLAGKGNNAGDGFQVARLLAQLGVEVQVCLTTEEKEFKGEAAQNYSLLQKLPISVFRYSRKDFFKKLPSNALVIDALFGTGIHSPLKAYYTSLMGELNKKNVSVISIDIPSGVHGDTGKVMGAAVRAELTVTFGLPKLGLLVPPGSDYVGKLEVRNIGFPQSFLDSVSSRLTYIQKEDIQGLLPKRNKNAHKGTAGHVLVVAGSSGKVGAAVMTVQSAFRSGVGLVTLLTHLKSLNVIAPQVKEAFLESFPTQENNYKKYLKDKKVIAIGPGMGFSKEAKNLVTWTLKHAHCPVVMDADALLSFQENPRVGKRGIPLILTPHPGEMARLIGKTAVYVQSHRLEVAQEFSKKYEVYLILKGAGTIIATPQGNVFINSTGNPAMATAGLGDVLTGMIASFIAQGVDVEDALKISVYLHGWMADQWVLNKKAHLGLMASDLIQALPSSIELMG